MNEQKNKTLINFKKAQSLLGKIMEMVENDEYCVDIMQQNLAVIGMLKSANMMLMEGHLNDCFSKVIKSGSEKRKQEMIREILQVTKLYNK
ncbi:MAG: metal-sensing transcriptional repressor [Actinobacteria bacterium]|nr:metal-sensing transcriptional repressor [Actinomycetota bacterium]